MHNTYIKHLLSTPHCFDSIWRQKTFSTNSFRIYSKLVLETLKLKTLKVGPRDLFRWTFIWLDRTPPTVKKSEKSCLKVGLAGSRPVWVDTHLAPGPLPKKGLCHWALPIL